MVYGARKGRGRARLSHSHLSAHVYLLISVDSFVVPRAGGPSECGKRKKGKRIFKYLNRELGELFSFCDLICFCSVRCNSQHPPFCTLQL